MEQIKHGDIVVHEDDELVVLQPRGDVLVVANSSVLLDTEAQTAQTPYSVPKNSVTRTSNIEKRYGSGRVNADALDRARSILREMIQRIPEERREIVPIRDVRELKDPRVRKANGLD